MLPAQKVQLAEEALRIFAAWGAAKVLDSAYEIAFPKTSAEQDYNRGLDYQNGLHGYSRDPAKALTYFEKAADKDFSEAQCVMGDHYRDQKDAPNAVKWYERAEAHNHSYAMIQLATIYASGLGPIRPNLELALKHATRAADTGKGSDAEFLAGAMHWNGEGLVQTDYNRACDYFELAAKQGHNPSRNQIGQCYALGRGRPLDYEKALSYFRPAAAAGIPWAEYNVGVAYENGDGVPPNPCTAFRWYTLAANHGIGLAKQRLTGFTSLNWRVCLP